MDKSRQKVTLAIDEELLVAAQKLARSQRRSVDQLVGEFLANLVAEAGEKRLARSRLKKAVHEGLVDLGDRNWSREDLYDR